MDATTAAVMIAQLIHFGVCDTVKFSSATGGRDLTIIVCPAYAEGQKTGSVFPSIPQTRK